MSLNFKLTLVGFFLTTLVNTTIPTQLIAQTYNPYGTCPTACDTYSENEVDGFNPLQQAVDTVSDVNADGTLTVCVGDSADINRYLKIKSVKVTRDNVSICGRSLWASLRNHTIDGSSDAQSGIIVENAKNFSLVSVVLSTSGDNGHGLVIRNGEVNLLDHIGLFISGKYSNAIQLGTNSKIKKIDGSLLYLNTNGDGSRLSNLYGAVINADKGSVIDEIIDTNFSFSNPYNFGIRLYGATINLLQNASILSSSEGNGGYGVYLASNSRISHIKGGRIGITVDYINQSYPQANRYGSVHNFSVGMLLHQSKIALIEDLAIGSKSIALYANESEIHQMKNIQMQTGNNSGYGAVLFSAKIGSINGFKSGKQSVRYATAAGETALYLYNSQIGLLSEADFRSTAGVNPLIVLYTSTIDQLSNSQLYAPTGKHISVIGSGGVTNRWKVTEGYNFY